MSSRYRDIPPALLESFRSNFSLLDNLLFQFRGTAIVSQGLEPYLKLRLNREVFVSFPNVDESPIQAARQELLESRLRFDPLFSLFREWARQELRPIEYVYHEYEGKVLFVERKTEIPRYRRRLSRAIKDITALVAYDHTVHELSSLACLGDRDSLSKLVRLDKVFLTANFTQQLIWAAQGTGDRDFFRDLAKDLRYDTYEKYKDKVRIAVACYLLWFLGFKDRPKREMLDVLEAEGICESEDPELFNQMLRRIGLVRYRKEKKVKN